MHLPERLTRHLHRHLHRHTSPEGRRWAGRAGVAGVALLGALVGAALAPSAHAQLGPLSVVVHVRPSLTPGTSVDLPPVGSVRFDTHSTPVQINASITGVDAERAQSTIESPTALDALVVSAPDLVREAALRALLWSLLCAFLGAGVLCALVTRAWRGVASGLVVLTAGTAVLALATVATFDSARLAQPRFTGLLSSAPYVQRRTQTLAARLESYRSGLSDFVQSVTTLYAVGQRLPRVDDDLHDNVTTVLHISDLHLNPLGYDLTNRLVGQFKVDAVIDSGDLSTWGTAAETGFVSRIGKIGVPYVFVRGNHDSPAIAAAVAGQRGAVVLDGQVKTVAGLRVAGVADPRNSPQEGKADKNGKDQVLAAAQSLAGVIQEYDAAHPTAPVQLAVVHDPTRLDPLLGEVPLVLSGHMHERDVEVRDGTRVMVEGTTGGAGLTADGLQQLTDGKPVPLEATLLYFTRTGPNAGRLLAYDEVTIGGLGLTSVSIDRTLVPRAEVSPVKPASSPSASP